MSRIARALKTGATLMKLRAREASDVTMLSIIGSLSICLIMSSSLLESAKMLKPRTNSVPFSICPVMKGETHNSDSRDRLSAGGRMSIMEYLENMLSRPENE